MDQELLNSIINSDMLNGSYSYNIKESPSTTAYYSVAAQNNPDYAQAIADVHKYGDINNAYNNLLLHGLQSAYQRKTDQKDLQDKRDWATKLMNTKRQWQIDDRDRAERLQLLFMPREDHINYATDWQGNVNPEQKAYVDRYNNAVDARNNAKNLEDFAKNMYALEDIKREGFMNSSLSPADSSLQNKQEYLYADDKSVKNILLNNPLLQKIGNGLNKYFGIKIPQGTDIAEENKQLAQNSINSLNYDKINDSSLQRLGRLFGIDGGVRNADQFMRTKNVGFVNWNATNQSVNIAMQMKNNPEINSILGDPSNYQLVSDPTDTSGNNNYIIHKGTKQIFKIETSADGTIDNIVEIEEGDF